MRGPSIGAGAQLGVNVTVVPYVRIGAGSIIGAGSVVTKDVPEGVLAYGNPAVTVRELAGIDIEERVRTRAERSVQRSTLSAIRPEVSGGSSR